MKRFSLSIAGMMALILVIAVGFAALREGTVLWASVTFSLAVTLLLAAILGAFAARGPARMAWIGFALFGWAYLLICLLPWWNGNGISVPPLPTMVAYELLLDAKWKSTISNPKGFAEFANTDPRGEVFLERMAVYATGRMSKSPTVIELLDPGTGADPANPTPLSSASAPKVPSRILVAIQLRRIVHSIAALAFGLVGAAIGRGFAAWYGR